MALGIKIKKGVEQGDIIQCDGQVKIFQKIGLEAIEYDNAVLGDRIGYATGQTVKIGTTSYIEFVMINRVLASQSPDFSSDKFYIRSNEPVSFKANPDYNYLTTAVASGNTNFWGSLGSILNTVLGIFSGNRTTVTGPTANDSNSIGNNNAVVTQEQPQESWLKKNALLVGSGVVIAVTVIVFVVVGKKKDKK
ncbi:hypothetical protein [Emticicia sp. BO119]|uniref:hypothetical protein n=1 Tax=Emticicia sp. BO119 TaxID=2757768 RepID=UPI0015F01C7E|nr:hypothetical protein [Emticicia sp. BO119]MBA4849500.1 hypothetical protein [Emticicia sp. BO119]